MPYRRAAEPPPEALETIDDERDDVPPLVGGARPRDEVDEAIKRIWLVTMCISALILAVSMLMR